MKIKGKRKSNIKVECLGDEKVKRIRKVGESVNVIKKKVQFDGHNKKITLFIFLNKKREKI